MNAKFLAVIALVLVIMITGFNIVSDMRAYQEAEDNFERGLTQSKQYFVSALKAIDSGDLKPANDTLAVFDSFLAPCKQVGRCTNILAMLDQHSIGLPQNDITDAKLLRDKITYYLSLIDNCLDSTGPTSPTSNLTPTG
jgi:hypothetical protein